jgi:hypothetical protein
MLRKITLSLLMLISVVVLLPFVNSAAHGLRQSSAAQKQRRLRRHSRAWWRRYRARMRMRNAAAAAALAHRKALLGPVLSNSTREEVIKGVLPALPAGWNNPTVANNGELRFRTDTNASAPSQATISVVARSRPTPAYLTHREQTRLLAGVAFSDLRRIVIDKMINSGGWVINDYERHVNGARAFVVIAQTPGDGKSPQKSWQFYFAEVEGKIYSLTLNTPLQFSDRLAGEGEKFLSSLRAKRSEGQVPKR